MGNISKIYFREGYKYYYEERSDTMNIVRKTVNNFEYAYHRIMREYALKKQEKYIEQDRNGKFQKYGLKFLYHLKKCDKINI